MMPQPLISIRSTVCGRSLLARYSYKNLNQLFFLNFDERSTMDCGVAAAAPRHRSRGKSLNDFLSHNPYPQNSRRYCSGVHPACR
jgi:hypothetical protein